MLNDSLLESELFGHEKGAFTGAERRKIGRFELANGGTLLLDEAGDIPPPLQAKLLRVLQTGQFERVGGTETIQVDVRIIAASHKVLEEEVKKGRFRADLFYRLNVIRIDLPPLRERTEDIPLLATHFLQQQAAQGGTRVREITSEAMQALLRHSWPGNVRELENAVSAGVALADGSALRRDDLPESVAPRMTDDPRGNSMIDIARPLPDVTAELISQVEREYLTRLLLQFKGNVARVRPAQRPLTPERHPEAAEVRPRPDRIQGPAPPGGRSTGGTLEPTAPDRLCSRRDGGRKETTNHTNSHE